MAARRIHIYLTDEQRTQLDALVRTEGRSLAELIREAVHRYLTHTTTHPGGNLRKTFGIAPDFEVPSRDEWDERERRFRRR